MKYPNLASPTISEFGEGLAGLVNSLYSGDGERKRAERQAAIDARNAQTELARARIDEIRRKSAAEDAQAATFSNLPTALAEARFPGMGEAVTKYRKAGGIVQPEAETAEMPGIIGGYEMERPRGFTPEAQARLADDLYNITAARALPGKSKIDDLSAARATDQKTSIIDEALRGARSPKQMEPVAAAFGAIEGRAPYKEGSTGQVLQGYTGEVAQTPVSQANVALKGAQAADELASAGQHAATAGKTRSETLPQASVEVPGVGSVPVLGKDISAAAAKSVAAPAASTLDDAAVEEAAHRYYVDGTLPPNLGRGTQGAANTAKILNRAAQIAQETGDNGESGRIRHLSNKAATSAMLQLRKQQQMVGAFEKNALMNADIALAASGAVDRTGMPVLNRWLIAGRKNILGDPDVSRFNAAVNTFVNEYAKIMSGSMGNTVVSDSLRKETESMLSTKDTPEQFAATVNLMKQEMRNRMAGFDQQLSELRQSMVGGTAKPAAAPVPAATSPAPSAPPAGGVKSYGTEADAEAAAAAGLLRPGERVIIGGRSGTWQ